MSAISEMLDKRVWAVVGVSADRGKFGYKVYKKLKNAGYTVYAVNPHLTEIDGDRVYPDLSSLPEVPDVVNCVVRPEVTKEVVSQCAIKGIRYVWMQPGADGSEAIALAKEHRIEAKRACVLSELRSR